VRGLMLLMEIVRPAFKACKLDEFLDVSIDISLFITEFVFSLLLLGIVIIAVYSYTVTGDPDNNYEQNILKYDNVLYSHMHDPHDNANCPVNFQGSKLLSRELNVVKKDQTLQDPAEFYQIDKINAVYRKTGDNATAVDLKTYYWTRKWRQHASSQYRNYNTDPDIYYCSAGFERHWGMCHNSYYSLSSKVQDKIKKYTEWVQLETSEDVCVNNKWTYKTTDCAVNASSTTYVKLVNYPKSAST
jgi:hypothetical protein